MKRIPLFWAFLSLIFVGNTFGTGSVTTDAVVIRNVARILKIEPEKIKVELPFALQNPPGDALDIVEIVMAVEDDLGIKMSDRELDARAGSRGVQDIAQKLTVRHIQQFAGELHRKKLQKSPAKQTGSPAVQVK